MKIHSILIAATAAFILMGSCMRPIASTTSIQLQKDNTVQRVLNVTKNLENNFDSGAEVGPEDIFREGFEDYQKQFASYQKITGLNVEDKEAIDLPDFDKNYIAPTFADVMHDYQSKIEQSFSPVEMGKYENLRKTYSSFDKYVALNQTRYQNLQIAPKYSHEYLALQKPVIDAFAGLVLILTSAGLTEVAISAATGCASTLTIAISSSAIPIIGWAVAATLAAGALIAFTVILVQNWNLICSSAVFSSIKAWFLVQFDIFSNIINPFFDDVAVKGDSSTIASRERIGGKDLVWRDKATTKEDTIALTESLRRTKNKVFLMKNVKKKLNPSDGGQYIRYWTVEGLVDDEFVTDCNIYDYGISTYTWYNNTARYLMINGSSKLEFDKSGRYAIGYHRFMDFDSSLNGWNHYHIFESYLDPETSQNVWGELKTGLDRKAHSFFGLMYLRPADGVGMPKTFPTNP